MIELQQRCVTAEEIGALSFGVGRRVEKPEARPRILFVTDFYLEGVLAGVVSYAREAGWILDANMRLHGRFPPRQGAAGILATIQTSRVRDWLEKSEGCPIVRILVSKFPLDFPAVEPDYFAAAQAGARHLLSLGHSSFAFYSLSGLGDEQEAREGFSAVMKKSGRDVHFLDFSAVNPNRDVFDTVREERHRWLAAQLFRLRKPLAVMADDDRRALELVEACKQANLRVPEDVAILGCDNHWVEQGLSSMPLSSVDMNFRGMGREAAALLDRMMSGCAPAHSITKVPPLGVVARQSTSTFVTDSPGITAAVVYLREHFREPLRLADLARRARMSERVFEKEFKKRLGRPPRDELRRARTAYAAKLLRDTDLKLEAIAAESGFGSAAKLCVHFAREYHSTPKGWRASSKQQILSRAREWVSPTQPS